MGNICHEPFLVVLALCDFTCHVGERRGEIADFVLAVHLKLISEIADGILLCRVGNLAQRQIDHLCKEKQNDE